MDLEEQRQLSMLLCEKRHVKAVFNIIIYQQDRVHMITRGRSQASEVRMPEG